LFAEFVTLLYAAKYAMYLVLFSDSHLFKIYLDYEYNISYIV